MLVRSEEQMVVGWYPEVLVTLAGIAFLGLAPVAAAADCPTPVPSGPWLATLEAAEQAFIDLDKDALLASSAQAAADLPCLNETVSTDLAARFHRIQAFGSWLGGDQDTAHLYFASANAAAGGAPMPEYLVPAGHPMEQVYAASGSTTWVKRELDQPGEGRLLIDGAATLALSEIRPAVVQYVGADGAVAWTVLHLEGIQIPAYPLLAEEPLAPPPVETADSSRAPRGLLVATLAGAVVSGAALAASLKTGQDYWDSTSVAQAEDRRQLTNGLIAGSAVGFGLTVGMGAVAVVKWKF